MKKIGALLLILVLTFSFVLAQGNESNNSNGSNDDDPPTDNVDAAYQCLEDLIENKDQSDLSLQEAIFSTLALGGDSKLKGAIEDFEGNGCWPSSSCTLKDTAQVVIAYERINKNTDDVEEWLLSKEETATELTWFLQIDINNHIESSCTLSYDDEERTVTIGEDQKITGNPGSCLSISSSGYWLKVNNNCIEKTFRTSCDQDFLTSLLYQRQGSSTIFISPTTHSAAALGTTEETINSKCFKLGGSCDYEGTLWAALALDHTGNEISSYLPYLLALSEENPRFFPSTFLYILTVGQDQYSQVVQAQQQNQFWQAPNTAYNRFYDSALAMLSLQGTSAQELSSSQDYFLSIQTPEGCWNNNNIRDTAFLLYAGWPTSVSGGGNGEAGPSESCISQGFNCVSSLFSCTDAGGSVLEYECDAVLNVCCSVPLRLETCATIDGIICSANQRCSGLEVNSLDGSCCLDSCQVISEATECELNSGSCHSECVSSETQEPFSCGNTGDVCCIPGGDTDEGTNIWTWIIVLAILIALVVFGILYRKKIQLWIFKLKNRKKGPGHGRPGAPGRRPPYPPYGPGMIRRPTRPGMLRPRMPIQHTRAPIRRTGSKTDKELDETLKKLKEMSK